MSGIRKRESLPPGRSRLLPNTSRRVRSDNEVPAGRFGTLTSEARRASKVENLYALKSSPPFSVNADAASQAKFSCWFV